MNSTAQRIQLCEAILDLIAHKRQETGDPDLGLDIEKAVLQSHIQDLERDILANPGAFGPWLIPNRRGLA